jgi:guanylate cyclase soluble subunit beta
MYGLIHNAIKQLVLDNHGEATWQQVMLEAGNPGDAFLTMRSYEDEITLKIVAATAQVLDLSVEECLEIFGSYWMATFAPDRYGSLLNFGGESVAEFLSNLDDMHDHISTSFTDFIPPSFKVDSANEQEIKLTYRSERSGLTPFVRGILLGMKQRFQQSFDLTEKVLTSDGSGEETKFLIQFRE